MCSCLGPWVRSCSTQSTQRNQSVGSRVLLVTHLSGFVPAQPSQRNGIKQETVPPLQIHRSSPPPGSPEYTWYSTRGESQEYIARKGRSTQARKSILIQNRGISGPTKRTGVLQKYFFKKERKRSYSTPIFESQSIVLKIETVDLSVISGSFADQSQKHWRILKCFYLTVNSVPTGNKSVLPSSSAFRWSMWLCGNCVSFWQLFVDLNQGLEAVYSGVPRVVNSKPSTCSATNAKGTRCEPETQELEPEVQTTSKRRRNNVNLKESSLKKTCTQ